MHINFLTDDIPESHRSRIRYVLDFMESHPCKPAGKVLFNVNADPHGDYFNTIYYTNSIKTSLQELVLTPDYDLLSILPGELPPLFMHGYLTSQGTSIFSVETRVATEKNIFLQEKIFAFDWVATIFFHLSRIEEYQLIPGNTDKIGLKNSESLLICNHDLHHEAIVDRLVEAIFLSLGLTPQEIPTTLRLTHDLDSLKLFGSPFTLLRYMGGVASRTGKSHFFASMAADYWHTITRQQPDPADTFDWMLRKNNNGVLYLGHGRHTEKDIFPSYDHPRMAQILQKARDLGYEIGFHPGFGTWQDAEQWRRERVALELWLGHSVQHTRQHFLRFSFPHTADILEQEGIKTDSSLGFRDKLGFRCGTGVPFHLYNFKEERPYTWQEIPPVLMDIALLREAHYQGEAMLQLFEDFRNANSTNGTITTIFHNTIFYEPDLAGIPLRQLYDRLL